MSTSPSRPDPDDLLAAIPDEDPQGQRGRL